jgi:hypothetical protein
VRGDDGSSCLTPGSVLVASAIAGSVPIIELAHGNTLAVGRSARPCVGGRSRRHGERGIRITFAGWRIQARGAVEQTPEPLRLPPPLSRLSWDIAQSEFGVQCADFICVMGCSWAKSPLNRGRSLEVLNRPLTYVQV